MIVKELIEILQELEQDKTIYVETWEDKENSYHEIGGIDSGFEYGNLVYHIYQ